MSITFPRTDIMTLAPYSAETTPARLMTRQEFSRQANGVTRAKDLGPALWMVDFTTAPLPNDVASAFEATMDTLDGAIQPFEACDLRRINPIAYPNGNCNDGVLLSVNDNNKAISLSGLLPHQIVSAGDFLSFDFGGRRALHRAAETIEADNDGETAEFEVRPHIRPGWTLSPATTVTLKSPRGLFTLVPGSFSPQPSGGLHSVIRFQVVQYPLPA